MEVQRPDETPLFTRLRALVTWPAVAVFLILAAGALALGTHSATTAAPERLRHATALWRLLLAAGVATLVFAKPLRRAESLIRVQEASERDRWALAVRLCIIIGAVGALAVGWFALKPPVTEASHYKAWDFLDKRWVAASYLLAVALTYLPGLLKRLLEGGRSTELVDPAENEHTSGTRADRRTLKHGVIAVLVGCLLAIIYVASITPPALTRQLDTHELVQLGGLQAIANGAKPFLEARTQYGPGQQLLIYKLVRSTEMSVRGARIAHITVNCVAIAVVFSTLLYAFGWAVGAGMILLALFISPLQVTTFVGWGLIVRWLGPFLVGVFVPRWRDTAAAPYPRLVRLGLLGMLCGGLAWISQENGSTSVMTLMLVLAGAVIIRRMPIIDALTQTAVFAASVVITVLGLLLLQFGVAHLHEALTMYQSGSGLVFAGYTDTAWTDANTHWTEPLRGRGPAYGLFGWMIAGNLSGWRAAYFLTPLVIVGLTGLTLYTRRKSAPTTGDRHALALIGLLAAAAGLDLLTFFRADATHFVGMSLALAPTMVLAVVYLPSRITASLRGQRYWRAALVVGFFIVYPFLSANTEFRFAQVGQAAEGLRDARELFGGGLVNPKATLLPRLGYEPQPGESCCRSNKLTYGELAKVMRDVNRAAAGRSVLVDTKDKYSALGPVASAVYFLGDLKVGTTYVEPMMSIWDDADIAAAAHEAELIRPQCLLTGGQGYLLTQHVLQSLGSYTTQGLDGVPGALLYCRN